jgi:hypothetical protein
MEREADRIGFGVMTQAGFQPQGFVTMFEKLQQASRLNDNGAFPYLRTHPMTTERAPTCSRASSSPRAAGAADAGARDDAARAPACFPIPASTACAPGGGGRAPRWPRSRRRGRPRCCTRRAGGARACAMPPRARLLQRLEAAVQAMPPAQRQARLLAAEIALAGRPAARARWSTRTSERRPDVLLAAQAQVQTGRAREAAQRLQTWVATQPRDAGPGSCWRGLHRAGPGAARGARRSGRRGWRSSITRRRWTASRRRRTWCARAPAAATTSRRRSSTPARARSNHFFANRRSSADSITTPTRCRAASRPARRRSRAPGSRPAPRRRPRTRGR